MTSLCRGGVVFADVPSSPLIRLRSCGCVFGLADASSVLPMRLKTRRCAFGLADASSVSLMRLRSRRRVFGLTRRASSGKEVPPSLDEAPSLRAEPHFPVRRLIFRFEASSFGPGVQSAVGRIGNQACSRRLAPTRRQPVLVARGDRRGVYRCPHDSGETPRCVIRRSGRRRTPHNPSLWRLIPSTACAP
jgi:hypothetical protein